MEISISARHFTLPETLKTYTEEKIRASIETLPIKLISAKVVYELEKSRIRVTLVVNAKDQIFESDNTDFDAAIAFDASLIKVETQIHRFLDKKHDHHI